MAKIGIVLSGAGSKGAYEIGCIRAIEDHFGLQSIKCVSSASIGALITQAYGSGKLDQFADKWKNLDTEIHGRVFLSYCSKDGIFDMIKDVVHNDKGMPFEHYVSVWNYTRHRSEYIPFHKLENNELTDYMKAAIAVPVFSKGVVVKGDRILDGALLDNIPAYPLIDKDLDYIFCIYFDNHKYFFENKCFNQKLIKLFDFPNEKRLDLFTQSKAQFDEMMNYGYEYTTNIIKKLFVHDDKEQVYKAIEEYDSNLDCEYKPRLTADVVLNNINVMTKRYSKRLTNRTKVK